MSAPLHPLTSASSLSRFLSAPLPTQPPPQDQLRCQKDCMDGMEALGTSTHIDCHPHECRLLCTHSLQRRHCRVFFQRLRQCNSPCRTNLIEMKPAWAGWRCLEPARTPTANCSFAPTHVSVVTVPFSFIVSANLAAPPLSMLFLSRLHARSEEPARVPTVT